MKSLQEDLIETMNAITSAFAGVSREGGVSLHETRVLDDCGSDEERAKARAKDVDVRWQDVPDSAFEKPDLSLNFLDSIGFRYYIPAYMMWELKQPSGAVWVDCNTHGAVIDSLRVSQYTMPREQTIARFQDMFNESQSRAICKFLLFYTQWSDDEFYKRDAQDVLDWYWGQWK